MFESLSDRLQNVFEQLGRKGKLTEDDVSAAMREVRMALLEADVNLKVAKDFINRVKERAIGAEVQKSLKPSQQVIKIVHEELIETLGQPGRLNLSGQTPRVIMLVGLQGSGKTTTAAKLAVMLRRDGRRPFLVAGDTYRPAAVDQLVTLAKQTNMPYYEEGTSASPPDICVRGLEKARADDATVVILDTAGRLQIDDEHDGRTRSDSGSHQARRSAAGRRCHDRPGSRPHCRGLQRACRADRPDPDQSGR